uniref:Isopenicillin N synthase-like Fe(2+) 2OG dioxygenase domain-containing protein n=1 Tax=Hyaloperonospora arabidopsidis (strain Emoy2) TaxID=559515 RepID=M4BEA6_HYAAE
MMTLLELLDNVSRDCMKAVCEVLNIDERWIFDELLDDLTRPTPDLQGHRSTNYKYGASVLRIYNYHNKAVKDQASSKDDQSDDLCGVHADIGLVTVSPLATVPGLQIWNLERMVWADVEDSAAPLHFSVFAGETLGLLTHGVISAPLHRVPSIYIKNEAERRMSMPYFLRAMPDACLNPKAPIDDHITCRDFVENILHKNRPWRQSDPNNHAPPDY